MVRKEEGIMSYGDDFQAKSKYEEILSKAKPWTGPINRLPIKPIRPPLSRLL
jgi:hypothetical protein